MPTRSTLLISTLLLSGLSTAAFADDHEGTTPVKTGLSYEAHAQSDKDSSSLDEQADPSSDLNKIDPDSDDHVKPVKSPNRNLNKQVKYDDASSKDDEGDTYQASKPDTSISKHTSVQTSPKSTDESHMDYDLVDDKLARR